MNGESSADGGGALPNAVLYVDGGCQPNPGPGGYGAILQAGGLEREISGGFRRTTNNRMEISAVIMGLRSLAAPSRVAVTSDSQYVVNTMSRGWAKRWRSRNWYRTDTELAVNADLWAELLGLCERHQVTFTWVRGHAGNPLNERCDVLATVARSAPDLPPDPGYESALMRTAQTASMKTTETVRCAEPDRGAGAATENPAEFAEEQLALNLEGSIGRGTAPACVGGAGESAVSGPGRAVQLSLFEFP